MKRSKFGKIPAKGITERYRYCDFSVEQDIIFKPALKTRDTVSESLG